MLARAAASAAARCRAAAFARASCQAWADSAVEARRRTRLTPWTEKQHSLVSERHARSSMFATWIRSTGFRPNCSTSELPEKDSKTPPAASKRKVWRVHLPTKPPPRRSKSPRISRGELVAGELVTGELVAGTARAFPVAAWLFLSTDEAFLLRRGAFPTVGGAELVLGEAVLAGTCNVCLCCCFCRGCCCSAELARQLLRELRLRRRRLWRSPRLGMACCPRDLASFSCCSISSPAFLTIFSFFFFFFFACSTTSFISSATSSLAPSPYSFASSATTSSSMSSFSSSAASSSACCLASS
mmetsp:Transcript_48587/g.122594  ORF Transcript_48587/g.122594 Transcript_48587/m.122594 type:complete len:300 (-) Transcript_48587:303-1202(-)